MELNRENLEQVMKSSKHVSDSTEILDVSYGQYGKIAISHDGLECYLFEDLAAEGWVVWAIDNAVTDDVTHVMIKQISAEKKEYTKTVEKTVFSFEDGER